ncbi:FHA domain-containing protein [Planctomonas psychrotolerans]|uniref:FHA domain-containing protein n=1 Tax=Planctomonas psychrotolerans TaxID=2528712 RepID=UPI00123A795B|nr:FHA domain-containing protein [Planctomonas psychrotolerans]
MGDREGDRTPQNDGVPRNGSARAQPFTNTDTTATFSDELGAHLAGIDSSVSPEEREAVGSLPSGSALLVVRRGPNAGARFLLDADVTTVGRHPNADIFLDDVTVSRRHAQFLRSGTSFQVKDLGSLNGTYFDGVRIDTALLSDGAEVQVGKFRLTFYASRQDLVPSAGK